MCIICIKKSGVEMPTRDTIKTMWANNPDGAGYMYTNKQKEVVIKKGFMTVDALLDSLDDLEKNHDLIKTPVILHFRIGTAGGNIAPNTHPFPITEKVPVLQKLRLKTDVGMVHNGVISIKTSQPDISDTMEYIKDRLSLRKLIDPEFYKNELTRQLMYREVTSKLAFMNGDGEIYLVGDFLDNADTGLIYSNTTYKQHTYYLRGKDFDYDNWYNSYKYKKMFMMLDSTDCYVRTSQGEYLEADGFYMDYSGAVYNYDYPYDRLEKTDYTAVTHEGLEMKYTYNKFTCDLMEYNDNPIKK